MKGTVVIEMTDAKRQFILQQLTVLQSYLANGVRMKTVVYPRISAPPKEIQKSPTPFADAPKIPETRCRLQFVNDQLQKIAAEVASCAKCRLSVTRNKTVLGEGTVQPLVLVVGEGPGAEEDSQGLPFVGPAGILLDKMLYSIGLDRKSNCYITNIVKCRPPANRDPFPDERNLCLPYLSQQISLLKPRYILCLGRVAAQTLSGSSAGIGQIRGKWFPYEGRKAIATYHPSALLRDSSLKKQAWEDLKILKAELSNNAGEQSEQPVHIS